MVAGTIHGMILGIMVTTAAILIMVTTAVILIMVTTAVILITAAILTITAMRVMDGMVPGGATTAGAIRIMDTEEAVTIPTTGIQERPTTGVATAEMYIAAVLKGEALMGTSRATGDRPAQ